MYQSNLCNMVDSEYEEDQLPEGEIVGLPEPLLDEEQLSEEEIVGLPWPLLDEEAKEDQLPEEEIVFIAMNADLRYFFEDIIVDVGGGTKNKRQNAPKHGIGKQMQTLKEVLKPDQNCGIEFDACEKDLIPESNFEDKSKSVCDSSSTSCLKEKIETAKRKLRHAYEELENAERRKHSNWWTTRL